MRWADEQCRPTPAPSETAHTPIQSNPSAPEPLPVDTAPTASTAPESTNNAIITVEEIPFDDHTTDADDLFESLNFKVRGSVGTLPHALHPNHMVVDTGSGPNLVRTGFLRHSWRRLVEPAPDAQLVGATNATIPIRGIIPLYVRLGDHLARIWFGVTDTLPVDVVLGTHYQRRCLSGIFPSAMRIRPLRSRPIPILDSADHSNVAALVDNAEPIDKVVRVARQVVLPPLSETPILVRTSAVGLVTLYPHVRCLHKRLTLLAAGVMDVEPMRPFYVLVANLSRSPCHLPKNMAIAHAFDPPPLLVDREPHSLTPLTTHSLIAETRQSEAPTVLATSLRKRLDAGQREQARTRTAEIAKSDETRTEADWRSLVNIDEEFADRRDEITAMLDEFASMWDGHLGRVSIAKHRIELQPGARPSYSAPYRAGPKARDFEKSEIDKMLKAGVIEPAKTEWAAPIVFAPKKDGSLRFCVDYRRLNAETVRDSYPIPRMDECIDSLGDAQLFSTLDANSGYWQIEMAEEDKNKTAFTTHYGLFRYLRMPFGLKNAPATFQRAIDIILSTVKWQFALIYLDDVVVFSRTFDEHMAHLAIVLRLLKDAGITLRLSKCHFFKREVDYLGHIVRPGELLVAPKSCEAVAEFEPPRTQTELRSFLGLCNVYRRFVKDFAKIAAPLNDKLRKGEPARFHTLNQAESDAFAELKERLTSPPVLALPRRDGHLTLDTDACARQLGCVLLQTQPDGTDRPLGYWSRSLSSAERNYDTTERECLAVVWSVLLLRPYLEHARFTVRTDHSPLKWLLNLKDCSGRLARWRLRLLPFHYDVVHKAGLKHQAPDALSRLPTAGMDNSPIDDDLPDWQPESTADALAVADNPTTTLMLVGDSDPNGEPELDDDFPDDPERSDDTALESHASLLTDSAKLDEPITVEELAQEQKADRYCQSIAELVGKPQSQFDVDRRGLLVRKSRIDGALQKLVPTSLRARVLRLAHYPLIAGHPGARRMYDTLRAQFYWPHMANDIFQAVRDCRSCARVRGTTYKHRRFLRLFPAEYPLQFIAIDLLGPLPKSKRGNRHVLVVTCRFSKLARAIPLARITSASVVRALLESWIYPYGLPSMILSDNGVQFTSKFFEAMCTTLGVKHLTTTTYHPQTNGQVERYNRTLVARLRHYVAENQADWDDFVQPLTYAYNTQVHRSTGRSPFDLVLSRSPTNPTLPTDTALPTLPANATRQQVELGLLRRLASTIAQARSNLATAADRYKFFHDRTAKLAPRPLPGQRVFIDRPSKQHAVRKSDEHLVASKLSSKAYGPFRVIAATDDTVTIDEDGIEHVVSTDRVTVDPSSIGAAAEAVVRARDDKRDSPTQGAPSADEEESGDNRRYVVDRLVDHRDTPAGRQYKVRWYGYPAEFDTFEPVANLPHHFVARYHRREQRRSNSRTRRRTERVA